MYDDRQVMSQTTIAAKDRAVLAFFTFFILAIAPNASYARVWYDGGLESDGVITFEANCPESEDSPADSYKNWRTIGGAKLIDHGDRVEVEGGGATAFYFKTRAACEKWQSRLREEKKREEEREDERLSPYR